MSDHAHSTHIQRHHTQQKMTLELSHLLGRWVNVNTRADFIECFDLVLDGECLILTNMTTLLTAAIIPSKSRGSDEKLVRFPVEPVASPGSELAAGFYRYQQPSELIFAANEKNGVLVLQTYRQNNQDEQSRQLTREFYYRQSLLENDQAHKKITGEKQQQALQFPQGTVSDKGNNQVQQAFKALIGDWFNTYNQTSWINTFSIEHGDTGWILELGTKNEQYRWPSIPLIPYAFDDNETGFVAHCCQESFTSLFCAYSNKGLLVVIAFFVDSSSTSEQRENTLLCREFYVKQ